MKAGIRDSENTSIGRQRRGKHISAVTNKHAAIEELLEAVTSAQEPTGVCSQSRMQVAVMS
jgi:hypothetical protein